MRTRLALFFSVLFLALGALAQSPLKYRLRQAVPPDSVDVAEGSERHFWRASAEIAGFNLGLWAFDRFVQKGDFAYISLHSIKENFKHGFIWDNDNLGTNTFLHPYTGNLYYNAARSNGFNFWQSSLFAIGGSAMWEMFMEREYPSTNDIIATPVGGACIGEMMFRVSDALVDERLTGGNRFAHEFAVFLISPTRGLNRIVTGQAWRHSPTSGRIFGTPNFALQVSLGMKMISAHGFMHREQIGGFLRFDIEYGDRFEIKSFKPYDYFTVSAQLQFIRRQPMLAHIAIKGRLLAREFLRERDTHLSVGLFQHFDYFDSDSVPATNRVPLKLGIPASLGVGVYFRDIERRKSVIDAYLHANAVLLGSILSDHYSNDERNYNWCSGFSLKAGVNFVSKKGFNVTLSDEFYRLFTFKGYPQGLDLRSVDPKTLNVMGDKSVASFNVARLTAQFHIYRNIFGFFSLAHFYRSTRYRDFPNVKSNTTSLKCGLTLKL